VRPYRIVIAGHGSLPAALLATAELICGEIPDATVAGLGASETPDHYAEVLRAAIDRDAGAAGQVLVLCDLLGGTPYNVAAAIARRSPRVICLAGANLPMVVEALVERLLEVGRSGIVETERHRARRAS
jgi:PTS system mannose-specific IIA component